MSTPIQVPTVITVPKIKETIMAVDADCVSELLEADRVADSTRSIIREVSTDTQFLDNGQKLLGNEIADGFLGTARGQAATDRNVDQGFLGNARGQAMTDRNVDHGLREVAEQVTDVSRDVLKSSADSDRNVDSNFRWSSHEDREHERYEAGEFRGLERGQRLSDDRNSDGFYRTDRAVENSRYDTAKGFAHTNEHLSDAERRIEKTSAHNAEENAEAFGNLGRDLSDNTRRLDSTVRNASDAVQLRVADTENRLTRDLSDSERRLGHQIDKDVTHNLEEVSEALSSHDRRTSVEMERIHAEVKLEAERTRDSGVRSELETRLYLRDREDRTHDLIRQLADRNLDEMRGFERRSGDDEVKTRDLIRHIDEERAERKYIGETVRISELKTELAIQAALKNQCCDPCAPKPTPSPVVVVNNYDDDDDARRPRRRRESSQTV